MSKITKYSRMLDKLFFLLENEVAQDTFLTKENIVDRIDKIKKIDSSSYSGLDSIFYIMVNDTNIIESRVSYFGVKNIDFDFHNKYNLLSYLPMINKTIKNNFQQTDKRKNEITEIGLINEPKVKSKTSKEDIIEFSYKLNKLKKTIYMRKMIILKNGNHIIFEIFIKDNDDITNNVII